MNYNVSGANFSSEGSFLMHRKVEFGVSYIEINFYRRMVLHQQDNVLKLSPLLGNS